MNLSLWIFAILSIILPVQSVKTELFPYGTKQGDAELDRQDDISSSEFQLKTPIIFYNNEHHSVFINANGFISFYTDIPNFFNIQFPMEYPIIAPFYADVDTRGTGTIYYREDQSEKVLNRATNYVQEHFTSGANFKAKSVFIVTWNAVGSYNSKTDKLNTFQLAIASDDQNSYAAFIYVDIQWIYCDGKLSNLPEMKAQAGLMAADGRTTILPGSGTDQIRNIHKISNVGDKGLWLYHIGNIGETGNIKNPDLNIGADAITSQVPQSCSIGSAFCHVHASCFDYNPGFCCQCNPGHFGNGKSCLIEEEPQRINGKVSGTLNDQTFDDLDLHSYVVTADGRAYTAISRIDETLGFDMQTLLSTGVTFGWLFATRSGEVQNGYQITGGIFNSTIVINFPQTGHRTTIEQTFLGLDVFNYMRANIRFQGTIPSIPYETRIEVEDFSEEYTRISPGVIKSHSTHNYNLENTEIKIPFTVEQTITFDECAYGPIDETLNIMRLLIARSYIVYDSKEKVVRYAVLAAMEPLNTDNPCESSSDLCGPRSSCIVEGENYKCLCDPGFERTSEESGCVDIDECQQEKDNCHENAECFNQQGSFQCRCQPGFLGDGISCIKHVTCDELQCHENAQCNEIPNQSAECRCLPGFQGNGLNCEPVIISTQDCRLNQEMCDLNADCLPDFRTGQYHCQCLEGLIGNGIICTEDTETCDIINNCHPDADCVYDPDADSHYCICKTGFTGDGQLICRRSEENTEDPNSCNIHNNCHPDAECVYDARVEDYDCRCKAGFEGDGYACNPSDVTCDNVNICSIFAKCVYDETEQRYGCQCLEGYSGDGVLCEPQNECNSIDGCDPNAQCLYDNTERRYRCQCNGGFAGNGMVCSLESEISCENINCHPDAECIYDGYSQSHLCQCKSGFHGDGYICTQSVTACNVLNNCHPNAECAYDSDEPGYHCQCLQGYTGDGLICIESRSCINDPSECDANADCVPHPSLHQYVCQCRPEYHGDGYTCIATSSYDGDFLLLNQGMATLRISLNLAEDGASKPVVLFPHQTAIGIDIDCISGQFYWADVSGGAIMKANYNGSNAETFINSNIISPECVAVDWVSRNIFWTDSGKDTIEVARIDTKQRKVLFNTGLINPRGIIAHPGRGKIYWTDWDRNSPKIETSNMDGTNREVFVHDNLGLPNLLTIDYDRDDLCWADAGKQKIECISIHGHNRRTVVAPVEYPFGLTNSKTTLFWTDWEKNLINSASKVAYKLNDPIKSPLGEHIKIYGIVYVPDSCPRVSNLCAFNNGGCKSLCLANGLGGRTCACPDEGDKEELDACNEIR